MLTADCGSAVPPAVPGRAGRGAGAVSAFPRRLTPRKMGCRSRRPKGEAVAQVSLDVSRQELTVHLERAFLVSVALPERPWIGTDPLEELRGLATTAGAVVVGGVTQRRLNVNPATYIGKGKLAEVQELAAAVDADVIIFDNDLSPGQG